MLIDKHQFESYDSLDSSQQLVYIFLICSLIGTKTTTVPKMYMCVSGGRGVGGGGVEEGVGCI